MSSFQGIWVPIVTPFHNGAIDFVALRRLAAHLLESAVAGLVVCGTTGEAAALDKDEQLAVLDEVLQLAPATRVIMGLAGNNLQELLAMQQRVLERPIAALLVPAPYYIRPSQAALEQFFHRLADASSVPLIVYDIPYRTGVTLNQDTLLNIVRHPRIAAVKDCAGNLRRPWPCWPVARCRCCAAKTCNCSAPCAWAPAAPLPPRRISAPSCSCNCTGKSWTSDWRPPGPPSCNWRH